MGTFAPVALNDFLAGTEDTARVITTSDLFGADGTGLANDYDLDSANFANIQVTSLASGGKLLLNGVEVGLKQVISVADLAANKLVFVPNADFNGSAFFKYRVSDGTSQSNEATVSIQVAAVNDAPVAADDAIATVQDTARVIGSTDLFAIDGTGALNDRDVDGGKFASITVTALASNGQLFLGGVAVTQGQVITAADIALNKLSFVPDAGFHGAAAFKYTVSDGQLSSNEATVTIQVTQPPVAADDAFSILEDQPLAITADSLFGADGTGALNDFDADSARFSSITITAQPTHGQLLLGGEVVAVNAVITLADMATKGLVFQPDANYNGVADFRYKVSDGTAWSNEATVTVSIAAVNDAPVDTSELVFSREDTPLAGNVLANATDVEGDAVSVTGFNVCGVNYAAGETVSVDGVGSLRIDADGSYSFVPVENYNGLAPVATYTVSDGQGGIDTSTLLVWVTPVNDAPVDANEVATTLEDVILRGNVLANATDIDGDALSVTQFAIGNGTYAAGKAAVIAGVGTFVINASGSYTFTPAANYNGPVPVITYTVSDGHGGSDTSTLGIAIQAVNDAPVDLSEAVTVLEDNAIVGSVLANASDVEGDPIVLTKFTIGTSTYAAGETASIAGVGSLTLDAAGAYTFTPVANYNGLAPTVTYTVSDGQGGFDTSTLRITVQAVNDAPVDQGESVRTLEDTAITGSVLANASDVDKDLLSVSKFTIGDASYAAGQVASIAGVGTLVIDAAGKYTFTPAADYNGTVPVVSYTVSDGRGGSVTSTLSITIDAVNDAPADADEAVSTPEDTALRGNVLANAVDVDGDAVAVTQFAFGDGTHAAGETVSIAGVGSFVMDAAGDYTFTPAPDYNGPVPVVTYTVADAQGASDTSTLTLSITAVNDAPVAVDEAASGQEDNAITGNVLVNATDVDGDALSVTGFEFGGNAHAAGESASVAGVGTLVIDAAGNYTFTPDADYNGAVPAATFTVADGQGGSAAAVLSLTVEAVNDNPVDADEAAATPEDTAILGNVLVNASDVDHDLLAVSSFAFGGTTVAAGEAATVAGVGTLVIATNGDYSFTPAADYNGPVPVASYTVSDGQGGTDTSTLSLTIEAVNDAPVDADEAVTTPEDTPVSGNVLEGAYDVDGDTPAVTQFAIGDSVYAPGETASLDGVGTVVMDAAGAYTFTPAPDFNGPGPVVTYTVADGNGGSDTSVLAITVEAVNDAPVDGDEAFTVSEDGVLAGSLLDDAIDIDGDVLAVSEFVFGDSTWQAGEAASVAGVGTLVIDGDGSFSFRPDADYDGLVPVASYTVSDGHGGSDVSTLAIAIEAVNDAPRDADEAVTMFEDAAIRGNVLDNARDVEGDAIAVTGFAIDGTSYAAGDTATLAGIGTLVIDGAGAYTFTPVADYHGDVPVATYTVADAQGASDTSTLSITVAAVNDNPVDGDEFVATPEDAPLTGNVLANASDIDGDVLSVSQFAVGETTYAPGATAALAGGSTLSIAADGDYAFTPGADYDGAVADASYTVSDGQGGSDTSTLHVGIVPVNDAPIDGDESLSMLASTKSVTRTITGNVLANAADVEGDALAVAGFVIGQDSYTAGQTATVAGVGTLSIAANGSFSFTAATGFSGPVPSVGYTVADGHGGFDSSQLAIQVQPVFEQAQAGHGHSFWASHAAAWDGSSANNSVWQKLVGTDLRAAEINPNAKGDVVIGDVDGNGRINGQEVGFTVTRDVAASILSGTGGNDLRGSMLQEAISAQLNRYNGDNEPGDAWPGQKVDDKAAGDLLTEAASWLKTYGGAALADGVLDGTDYSVATGKFTANLTGQQANVFWRTSRDVDGSDRDIHATGQDLKNVLEAFNENQLVTSQSGEVAWNANDPEVTPVLQLVGTVGNGPDAFWGVAHDHIVWNG